ncbi:MAG: T9SS type A sorting domain-containing protein [Bacteroidetes bacterium]|nr:T9SS type A sorting domain-containing protein [Bacteroidota bacterium]
MKKLYSLLLICPGLTLSFMLSGQTPYVRQILTANSGKFEFSPPYQDFVTVQSYYPLSGLTADIQTIYTQSAQDILVSGDVAFIAAQDSIVKINLKNHRRITAIADSGVNKLFLFNGGLLVSKQWPVAVYFLQVLDTANLSLLSSVAGISGDCGYMTVVEDSVYVAVNGGWMGTEGKIAVVETTGWTVQREINLGAAAVGTMNIYHYNNKLFTVNKSPYATPDVGSISCYDLAGHAVINTVFDKNVTTGAGIKENLLFFGLGYGIGSFDLNTLQIADSVVVPDPGSAAFTYILSAAVDSINDRLYVNIGDYVTAGICLVTSLQGDTITTYPTGISSDAVTVDYQISAAGSNELTDNSLQIYPNPATTQVTVETPNHQPIKSICIFDLHGRMVTETGQFNHQIYRQAVAVDQFPAGIYLMRVLTEKGVTGSLFRKE